MIYVLSGGGKTYAFINVTYPAGSTCTCTDGSKTLKLKDTSGKGVFHIPYAATWTVTCTDGKNTKSKSVEISSEGQSVSVELIYAVYIFVNGAGDYAGAYQNIVSTSLVNNKIHAVTDGGYGNCFAFAKAVDVSKFTKLRVKMAQKSYAVYKTNIGVLSSKPTNAGDIASQISAKVVAAAIITDTSNTEKVFEADIGSVQSGNYYIGGIACATFDISEIWLE